jgi:phosphoglucomutase
MKLLVDTAGLERAYFGRRPDVSDPKQLVVFGSGGHRGSSLRDSFNEAHVLAITQAVCDYRHRDGASGPLYMGKDTHALSALAQDTALEVLTANGVETVIHQRGGVTPTPVVSWFILAHNRCRKQGLADGIVLTPCDGAPEEGGLRYDSSNGGPIPKHLARWIDARANELLRRGNAGVRRVLRSGAVEMAPARHTDFVLPYVTDLRDVVDMESIRGAGIELAIDPLDASHYWELIGAAYHLLVRIARPVVDATCSFAPVDRGGETGSNGSSAYSRKRLVNPRDRYDLALARDEDSDRYGIVTPSAGLMNPNHYLALALRYLLLHRPRWPAGAAAGKTLASSSLIDRVAGKLGRRLSEVPMGFEWLVPGLLEGSSCFAADGSGGATFLRRGGTVWTTDWDGIVMGLLAAEMTARIGRDLGEECRALTAELGDPQFAHLVAAATPDEKASLEKLAPEAVEATALAGERISLKMTRAPGNDAPIGGLKVVSRSGWFAALPSRTEDTYEIYAESFQGVEHLEAIVTDARRIVATALAWRR